MQSFRPSVLTDLKQLKESGTSILLVTHSSEQIVTHCDQAILLERGQVLEQGDPKQVVNRYYDVLFGKDNAPKIAQAEKAALVTAHQEVNPHKLSLDTDEFSTRPGFNPYEYRWGDRCGFDH